MLSKKKLLCLLAALAALWILLRIISTSPWFLELRIEYLQKQFVKLAIKEEAALTEIAEEMFEEASGREMLCYTDAQKTISAELENKIDTFLDKSPVKIEDVTFYGFPTWYPGNGCVFDRTLWDRRDFVYAWVGLIYMPEEPEHEPEWYNYIGSRSIPAVGDWYAVVLYGY